MSGFQESQECEPSSAAFESVKKAAAGSVNSAVFSPMRCDWTEKAISRLTALCQLRAGWDGHSGKPVDRDTVYFAAAILGRMMNPSIPMPGIVPLSYGGVQIEWHRNQWDVEIEVSAPYQMSVYTYDLANEVEDEFHLSSPDMKKLNEVLKKIARR